MKKLAQISVTAGDGAEFVMRVVDDAGQSLELEVTAEQLDAMIDAMDDLLADHEDEAFAVDDDAVYQKPLG